MALDAFLFSHHDVQAIVLCAGGSVFMYDLAQVAPEGCRDTRRHASQRRRRLSGSPRPLHPPTDGVAALYRVGRVVQGREAGVWPAALELHKQGFLGGAGEVARSFEGAVCAAGTLFFLEQKVGTVCEHNKNVTAPPLFLGKNKQKRRIMNVTRGSDRSISNPNRTRCVVSPAPDRPKAPAVQGGDPPSV